MIPNKVDMTMNKEQAIQENENLAKLRRNELEIKQREENIAENRIKKDMDEMCEDGIVLFSSNLSDSSHVEYTDENVLLKITETTKGTKKRIVYRGIFNPVQKLNIDGNQVFEVLLQDRVIGNVKDILSLMRSQGGVVSSNDLSDAINAIISDANLPTATGHSAYGVYNNDGKLSLCLNPYNMTDEQRRISFEVKKALEQPVTKESIQGYIDVLGHYHCWEIFPAMSYGVMAPFGYALKGENMLFPYLFHSSPEGGLGKSLIGKIFSQHLYGIRSQSMSSVYSDFRLADTLDCFCGMMTIDEAQKYNWHGHLGEKIKQSAENPKQDKRGGSDRSTQQYHSRLVGCFTGNGFPISGKSDLVRFIRVEFDMGMKPARKNRENSKKLTKKVRKLQPIGFRLVEHELKNLDYDIHELIIRIERYADDIVEHYSGSFVDARRPTAWGIIYEGLMAWERICKEIGVKWYAPPIKDFAKKVVNVLEPITFESKEVPLEDFLDWLEKWMIKEGEKYLDKIWRHHILELNNKRYHGFVILSGVLKEYNQAKKFSEIRNMGDLARSLASIGVLPVTEIYNPKRFKFGTQTKKGVFICENILDSQENSGNSVTNSGSTEEKDGYRQTVLKDKKGNQIQQKENDESYQVTNVSDAQSNYIDLSKYQMTIGRIEEIVDEERLFAPEIARRMGKTNLKEMGFIQDLLKQAVSDDSFHTNLKIDSEGHYFLKKVMEE